MLTKLALIWRILRAKRPSHWLCLANVCDAQAARLQWQRLLAVLAAEAALDAERAQVAAGTRLTHAAAQLLEEARRLTKQP